MIITCDHAFCINNVDGKCVLDEIHISNGGLCDEAFDSLKYRAAQARRNELDIKPKKYK